jgi:cystathionine beta-lyase
MQIAELADKYKVIVISDEIHAPLTFSDSTFTPFLAASDISKKVGITVTSASKAFNLAGLKCATIVAQDSKLNAMLDTMPESVHFRASLFGAIADAVAYKSGDEWLDGVIATLDENRRLVANLLEAKVPAIKYRIPDCSYLAWLDLSELNLGENPAAHFLEKGKVAFNPGHTYGADYSQFIRLNFGTSPEIITDSIGRILNSL